MAEYHPCPYFGGDNVEITDERHEHVLSHHYAFASAYWERVGATLRNPNLVIRREQNNGAILLYRWYDDLSKFVVAVVRSDPNGRHWLVTAHISSRIRGGEVLWTRG